MNGTLRSPASRRRFFLSTAAAFAGVAVVQPPVRAARYEWKFGFPLATDHPMNVRVVEAFAKIKRETNGDLDIKSYPNSALGGITDMISQTRLGALETMAVSNPVFDNLIPMASIESIAYAFPDSATACRALDGDMGKLLRAQSPAVGFVIMDKVYNLGLRHFTTGTRQIHTAADLQGMKIRAAAGKLFTDFFRSLGISATTITSAEVYSALQTHLIDGQESSLGQVDSQRLFEVQKYLALSRHMWSGLAFLVNKDKWEGLPPRYREIMSKHVNQGAILERRDTENSERSIRDKFTRLGIVINAVEPATFKAKLRSSGYYERWRKEYGETAWTALEKYAGPVS